MLADGRTDGPRARESLLTRLPRSGRIVDVTVYSRLHMFRGGPDWLGFMDVLPAERVAPLRLGAETPGSGTPGAGAPGAGSPGAGAPGAGAPGSSEPNDLDTALLAVLARDGRTPYADLAAAAGWSETRVRRRMDQLRDTRTIYYDVELDLPAFGFQAMAWLWLSVPPSHLADAGAALAKFPEAAYVTATTGPANLAACVICRDEESLYEFLIVKVGALPHVERVETSRSSGPSSKPPPSWLPILSPLAVRLPALGARGPLLAVISSRVSDGGRWLLAVIRIQLVAGLSPCSHRDDAPKAVTRQPGRWRHRPVFSRVDGAIGQVVGARRGPGTRSEAGRGPRGRGALGWRAASGQGVADMGTPGG